MPLSKRVPFIPDSIDDWRAVYLQHVNVVLEASESAIESVVRRLLPYLRQPVLSARAGTALALPATEIGTLILYDVHALTTRDQTRLLEWLNNATSRPQVISTSSQPLFPRVQLGLFAESLYYRLNVVLMRIDASNIGRLPAESDSEPAGSTG